MSVMPNAVGRLDDVVEAIRDGDRERVVKLLRSEQERLAAQHTAQFEQSNKTYMSLMNVYLFLIDIENDEKWAEARKACGWSGVDGFEGPIETLPPAKPALRAEELPLGTVMIFGKRHYTYRQNYGHGGNGKTPYQVSMLVFYDKTRDQSRIFLTSEVQELIYRGVEFRLPEGGME